MTVAQKIISHRANPTPSSEAALLAALEPLLRSLARRWRGPELDLDDLRQTARLAAVEWLRSSESSILSLRWSINHALRGAVRGARLVRGVSPSRVQPFDVD